MKNAAELKQDILSLNGRGYPAYKSLKGAYSFKDYVLSIDHVQSDPFASPSDLSIHIENPGFPAHLYENKACRIALQDALLRLFSKALRQADKVRCGSGKSGKIDVSRPVQEVLERTACTINPETGALVLRLHAGFPAKGRTILAKGLVSILFDVLPPIVQSTLFYQGLDANQKEDLQRVYELTTDQQYIRAQMQEKKLAAFVADGSILPRASGISDLPMQRAKPFVSPEENRITFDLPSGKMISGLAIPEGITLIVGGGYHGKSTLLEALERGVYNHIENDGREFVLTRDDASKIRAEDGRCVHNEDISLFISNLPDGKATDTFVSEDASGSTSQAANVLEAIDAGSRLLLIDEDTSATNFMIRDALMASVVHADEEPIIPFVSRIRPLYEEQGVSTILVAGSSGAYFDKADLILQMKDYEPDNITDFAKEKAAAYHEKQADNPIENSLPKSRIPLKNPSVFQDKVKIKTNGTDGVSINREMIDTRALEQIADGEQLKGIGKILFKASREMVDETKSLQEIGDAIEEQLDVQGLSSFGKGDFSRPRKQEILAAFNRWRSQKYDAGR